jgi:hypothetical protein
MPFCLLWTESEQSTGWPDEFVKNSPKCSQSILTLMYKIYLGKKLRKILACSVFSNPTPPCVQTKCLLCVFAINVPKYISVYLLLMYQNSRRNFDISFAECSWQHTFRKKSAKLLFCQLAHVHTYVPAYFMHKIFRNPSRQKVKAEKNLLTLM